MIPQKEWTNGTPENNYQDGTQLDAADFDSWNRELVGVLDAVGIAPDAAKFDQLLMAIKTMSLVQTATAFTTAGAAPNFTLAPSPPLTAYAANQRFRVKFNASGVTGSNTLNVSGLGAKSLKQYDGTGAKVAATVANGQLVDVEYDGVDFVLFDPLPVSGIVPGAVTAFAMSSAPTGWLKCNGAAISRESYAGLFAAIGTTYGVGDGASTFNLPDLRGEFVRGWDDARGIDSGRAFGSTQSSQNLAHTHTGTTDSNGAHTHSTHGHTANAYPNNSTAGGGSETTNGGATGSAGAHTHTFTSDASGGSEARPRNIALLYCIKF